MVVAISSYIGTGRACGAVNKSGDKLFYIIASYVFLALNKISFSFWYKKKMETSYLSIYRGLHGVVDWSKNYYAMKLRTVFSRIVSSFEYFPWSRPQLFPQK